MAAWEQYLPQLEQSRGTRDKLLEQYNAYASLEPTFFQRLLDELKKTGNYPSENTIERSLSARAPKGVVMNPGFYENLAGDYGSARRATISDLMGRAQAGLESDVAARGGAYQQANTAYEDLISQYGLANEREQQQLAQSNLEAQMPGGKWYVPPSSSVSASSAAQQQAALMEILGGLNGSTSTQPTPQYSDPAEIEWNNLLTRASAAMGNDMSKVENYIYTELMKPDAYSYLGANKEKLWTKWKDLKDEANLGNIFSGVSVYRGGLV
jgi:hypothetical protein